MARNQLFQVAKITLLFLVISCSQEPKVSQEVENPFEEFPQAQFSVQALLSTDADTKALSYQKYQEKSFQAVTDGEQIPDGATIQTPEVGRASLDLHNNRKLAINRNSEVLLKMYQNRLRLQKGELLIKTPPNTKEPLQVETVFGTVNLQGASLDIQRQESAVYVNVLQGRATLEGPNGSIDIFSTEKGVLGKDGVPYKEPMGDMALLTDWTLSLQKDLQTPDNKKGDQETLLPPPGFGTLSAKTPGSNRERPFELLSQNIRVNIVDQVARTEVEQVFENPTGSVLEGSFRFTLPAGASVTRYAMSVGDQLMEGEVVERERGRKILKKVIDDYIQEQARLRDPALVEWISGNTFQTRIFPILPREKKRVILSYTQVLPAQDGKTRYVYPFAAQGMNTDPIGTLEFDAKISSKDGTPSLYRPLYPVQTKTEDNSLAIQFRANDFRAPADLVLDILSPMKEPARLVTAEDPKSKNPYFLLTIRPSFSHTISNDAVEKKLAKDWIFLIDTSQSRSFPEMLAQRGLLSAFLQNVDYQDRVRVFAYDYQVRELTEGFRPVDDRFRESIEEKLSQIEPAGASNLLGALEVAAEASEAQKETHILLLGDLTPSIGETRPEVLAQKAFRLFSGKNTRVSTLGIGASVDTLILEELPRKLQGTSYQISTGEDLASAALRILSQHQRPLLSEMQIEIDGVETKQVYPETFSSLPAGQEIMILGRYQHSGNANITLKGKIAGKEFQEKYQASFGDGFLGNQFVISQWALARIDALTAIGSESARQEAIALSKAAGVLSRYTSFIVLENDAMYREFKVEQTADTREQWTGEEAITYESIDPEEESEEGGDGFSQNAANKDDMPREPAPKAKKSSKVPTAPNRSFDETKSILSSGDADFGGGVSSGPFAMPVIHCYPVKKVSFRTEAPRVSAATEKKVKALQESVQNDPLSRRPRQVLLSKLMGLQRYPEALEVALSWYEIDKSNPALLRALSELYRLQGKASESVRMLSGVLDIDPEHKEISAILSRYAATKGLLQDVYALKLSRSIRFPSEIKEKIELATAAAALERWEEVISLLSPLIEVSETGTVKVKGRLTRTLKTQVLQTYSEALAQKSLPKAPVAAVEQPKSKRANLAVELRWKGDADLEMWVLGPRNQIFFGQGKEEQSLLLARARTGRYRVQVFDPSTTTGGTISGELLLTGYQGSKSSRKKVVPFSIPRGGGIELASMRLSSYKKCSSR